jgi:protein-S-isoprenylcysteine O-methyltransferase Ste14
MSEKLPNHPKVIVFPPLIPAATILLAICLQYAVPIHAIAALDRTWRIAIGSLLMTGVLLPVIGIRSMTRHGTNISPLAPTTVLVTEGVFSWTRNPFYTGGTLAMLGLAFLLDIDWLLVLAIPSAVLLHFGVVKPEETYLTARFGDAYRHYEEAVPRYLWPL